jgi:hypothetical protein
MTALVVKFLTAKRISKRSFSAAMLADGEWRCGKRNRVTETAPLPFWARPEDLGTSLSFVSEWAVLVAAGVVLLWETHGKAKKALDRRSTVAPGSLFTNMTWFGVRGKHGGAQQRGPTSAGSDAHPASAAELQ